MYFDPQPKTLKKDLFMRDKELKELSNLDVPLTLVLGPRRLGKTSLLKVFIHETNIPFILPIVDHLLLQGPR